MPRIDPALVGTSGRVESPMATLRSLSLAKVVREEVLGLILSGEVAPGSRLNEPGIAERLGVSRVPVREALRELEAMGLVHSRKNVGVFVRDLAPHEVDDLYELRAVLEGHAGARAAALADAPRRALTQRLEEATSAMREASRARDVPAYYAENLRFHGAVVEAGGNAALLEAYRGVVRQLHLARLRNLAQSAGMAASIAEHEAIVEALRDGDAARARNLLAGHVGAARHRLESQLKENRK